MPKYFKDTIIMMHLEWQDVQNLNISGTDPEGPLDRDFKIVSMQYHLFLILKDLFFLNLCLDTVLTWNSHTLPNWENYKLSKSLQNVAKGKE